MDNKTLVLEAGKFYRTRDGRKVRIYCLDGGGLFTIHGAYQTSTGVWQPLAWQFNGSILGLRNDVLDIVSEWREPVKYERWMNVYKCGASQTFPTKEQADRHANEWLVACVRLTGEG